MGKVVGYLRGMDERLQELSQQIEILEEVKRQAPGRRGRSGQKHLTRRVPSDGESSKSSGATALGGPGARCIVDEEGVRRSEG